MRLRWGWLTALVLAAALAWQLAVPRARLANWFEQLRMARLHEGAASSQTYVLARDQSMRFELPAGGKIVRILTNANLRLPLPDDVPADTRPGWRYALEYALFDGSDQLLEKGTYHFRAQLAECSAAAAAATAAGASELAPRAGAGTEPAAFYADDSIRPALVCAMQYALAAGPPRPTRLRLRLACKDPGIADVAVRVYCKEYHAIYGRSTLWQRTARVRKERLCRASVYPPALLSEYERRNLLRWQLAPLAPMGLEGRDYQRRTLYVRQDVSIEDLVAAGMPAGMPVGPGRRGVVPLPLEAGTVRLHCVSVGSRAAAAQRDELRVRWFGKGAHRRTEFRFERSPSRDSFELAAEAGLLEIEAVTELVVRVFWRPTDRSPGDEEIEITPEPNHIRAYAADQQQPVEYTITHVGDTPTPFRVDLRQLLSDVAVARPGAELSPARLRWEFLDLDGQVIRQGVLLLEQEVSVYDVPDTLSAADHVTVPTSYFFSLPAAVRRLRFCAVEQRVLVAGFTRPEDFEQVTWVPDDYFAFARADGLRRAWFLLRSIDHVRRLENNQTVVVRVQPRLPEDDPDIVAGRFQWEDYRPLGSWLARNALVPRDPYLPIRREAAHAIYYELTPNQDYAVRFVTRPGRSQPLPRLTYIGQQTGPRTIEVLVDGRSYFRTRVHAQRGSVALPPLPADWATGAHQVRILAGDRTRVMLSSVVVAGCPTYVKRLVHRLDRGQLTFQYTKSDHDQQVLALSLFRSGHAEAPGRAKIRIEIDGAGSRGQGPERQWTLTRRTYSLQPVGTETAPVLETVDETLDGGQICYLPLGSDMPPGAYAIRVERLGRPAREAEYVMLSRTAPGIAARREIRFERSAREEL